MADYWERTLRKTGDRRHTYPTVSESWGIVMESIYVSCWGCPLSGKDEDVFHM